MIIYLDFDGTVVEHKYPCMGRVVPDALRVVERLQKQGHKIILNTYRANCSKEDPTNKGLQEAIDYFKKNQLIRHKIVGEITLDGVLEYKLNPWKWEPKVTDEHIYIDDIAYGIPVKNGFDGSIVDWLAVEKQLELIGILKPE